MNELGKPSRQKMIDAAIASIRAKGLSATSVDDICKAAGVSKGSFFHHFESKEGLVLASVDHWNAFTAEVFSTAPYRAIPDPRDRLLGYVDFRMAILDMPVPEFTCLLGTLVQEAYQSQPAVRTACDGGMAGHIAELVADVEAAKALYAPDASWTAESVGYFIQSVLQGAFIFAKARQEADMARSSLGHLRRYLELLLPISLKRGE